MIDSSNSDDNGKRLYQHKLEKHWLDFIKEKIEDDSYLLNKSIGKIYANIPKMILTLNLMSKDGTLKRRFSKFYHLINTLECITITLSICLNYYSTFSYTKLASMIGDKLAYNIYNYFLLEKGLNKNELDFEEFKVLVNLNNIENIIKLGDFFMNIIQSYPHSIFSRKVDASTYYTNKPLFLELNDQYIDDIRQNFIIDPASLPMICIPDKWDEFSKGGYLLNKSDEIITNLKAHEHKIINLDSIYKTVNYLNSIEFSINKLMLNYILSEEGKYLLETIKADDIMQRFMTVELAKLYSSTKFYITHYADWRGRIYTQSFFLSYQSSDLSISLLNFNKGASLNEEGKLFFYIYGANSHNEKGIGKKNFNDRIK